MAHINLRRHKRFDNYNEKRQILNGQRARLPNLHEGRDSKNTKLMGNLFFAIS